MEAAAELDAVLRDARELTAGLDAGQWNWQPSPSRWSVAQCLEHIVISGEPYLPLLDAALAEGRARLSAGGRPVREGWLGTRFVRSMEPPPGMRIRTFRKLTPSTRIDGEAVWAAFESFHRRLGERLPAVEEVGPNAASLRSPFLPILRLTLGQAVRAILAHSRRHIWQAWAVRRAAGFPEGRTQA